MPGIAHASEDMSSHTPLVPSATTSTPGGAKAVPGPLSGAASRSYNVVSLAALTRGDIAAVRPQALR